ncbi:hypothetical protein K5X82_14875 [Halosquirtibacter xylanolyticus]|uniref:hypothetical protein n=1 Tax=Halosquirtibacter xylanolyticus TaxID=3374599 RepID=UPI003749FA3C|nr:hypothetical protein K5X82_14875 [Prolixibacteraceae bacterium]
MRTVQHLLLICVAIFATSCLDDDFKPKSIADSSMTVSLTCDMVNNSSIAQTQFFNSNGYTTELVGGNTVMFDDQPMPFYADGSYYALGFKDKTVFQGTFKVKGDNGQTYTNVVSINMTEPSLTESMIELGSPTTVEWDVPLVADETMSVYVMKLVDDGDTPPNTAEVPLITLTTDDDGASSIVIKGEETAKLEANVAYEVQCVRSLYTNKIDEAPSRGGNVITRLLMPRIGLDIIEKSVAPTTK